MLLGQIASSHAGDDANRAYSINGATFLLQIDTNGKKKYNNNNHDTFSFTCFIEDMDSP